MHIITTIGMDNATKAALPFIAAKGAIANGEQVDLFLMQEATHLGTKTVDLSELNAPGLPSVEDLLNEIKPEINSYIVCSPCAQARGLTEDNLLEIAEFGGAPDMAKQASRNDSTLTF